MRTTRFNATKRDRIEHARAARPQRTRSSCRYSSIRAWNMGERGTFTFCVFILTLYLRGSREQNQEQYIRLEIWKLNRLNKWPSLSILDLSQLGGFRKDLSATVYQRWCKSNQDACKCIGCAVYRVVSWWFIPKNWTVYFLWSVVHIGNPIGEKLHSIGDWSHSPKIYAARLLNFDTVFIVAQAP